MLDTSGKKTCAVLLAFIVTGCGQQSPPAAPAAEAKAPSVPMIPASDAIVARAEFNKCLRRWRERVCRWMNWVVAA